jgi:putative flippase GtrA
MTSGVRVPPREVVLFIAVGIAGLLTDVGVFNLGLLVGLEPVAASVVAFAFALVVSFVGNKHLTYADRVVPRLGWGFVVFLLINATAVGIVTGVVWAADLTGVGVWGLNAWRLAATAFVTVGRFFAYRAWVFHERDRLTELP